MSPYAKDTTVPVERTKVEIERLVVDKHKAEAYMTGHQASPPRVIIQFKMRDRIVRFELPLPTADGRRTQPQLEQATRSRWRALLLIIKAKLEAVENGVTTFEEEFLAHIVMPGDRTVGQYVIPQIGGAYSTGKLPRMLPAFQDGGEEPAK
jgi:hypothetical protein